jgi:DNA-directed RNA polymerase specialized sigma24 family protein
MQTVVAVDVPARYVRHRLPLVRMAILLVGDQASAEDVVQDAFIGLHRNRDKIRDPQAAVGYLRRSVINHARSVLRRRTTARRHLQFAEPGVVR